MPGILYVVATPIGNLEDVSLRTLRILREADLVAAEDTRRTAKLLAHHDIPTRMTSLYAQNEDRKIPWLLERLAAGERIAIVTDAGTPTVSDPGAHLIAAAAAQGYEVTAIPGPSAVMAALASSGFAADRFAFEGFAPRRPSDLKRWLTSIATDPRTVVFFEAPHRIRKTLTVAVDIFGERPIVVGRELTRMHEEILRGTTADVLTRLTDARGEFTVVLAPKDAASAAAEILYPTFEDSAARIEFSHLTENMPRRNAITTLAKKYGLSSREVYQRLEGIKSPR